MVPRALPIQFQIRAEHRCHDECGYVSRSAMTERAAHAARSILSARSLAATASAVRRRGPQCLAVAASAVRRRGPRCFAVASAAARGLRWLAAAASAAPRGLESLAAADRVPGPACPAAVADPVAVVDPVAADFRLLVLDRSSVHVLLDAQHAADCRRDDLARRRRAAVP